MSAGKITGGILALVGGAFILFQALLFIDNIAGFPDEVIGWFVNIAICSLAIVGGILGLTGKRAGGMLALIGGAFAIICGLITVYITWNMTLWPYSFFTSTLNLFDEPYHLFAGISIEALLTLAGGIVIIASGSDK
jgi:hypothetical protein